MLGFSCHGFFFFLTVALYEKYEPLQPTFGPLAWKSNESAPNVISGPSAQSGGTLNTTSLPLISDLKAVKQRLHCPVFLLLLLPLF